MNHNPFSEEVVQVGNFFWSQQAPRLPEVFEDISSEEVAPPPAPSLSTSGLRREEKAVKREKKEESEHEQPEKKRGRPPANPSQTETEKRKRPRLEEGPICAITSLILPPRFPPPSQFSTYSAPLVVEEGDLLDHPAARAFDAPTHRIGSLALPPGHVPSALSFHPQQESLLAGSFLFGFLR